MCSLLQAPSNLSFIGHEIKNDEESDWKIKDLSKQLTDQRSDWAQEDR